MGRARDLADLIADPPPSLSEVEALIAAAGGGGGGITLLGTITATGTSASLTGLDLTEYKFLLIEFEGLSHSSAGNATFGVGSTGQFSPSVAGSSIMEGFVQVSLDTGNALGIIGDGNTQANVYMGLTGITNASTSVAINNLQGFDGGVAMVYGLK